MALTATNASGQASMLSTPQNLLATDPGAFAEWLETARPQPVSAEDKARTLLSLPPRGEVAPRSDVVRRKLNALNQLLRATGRDSAYEIKVVDAPLARVGVFQRSVILISQNALALIDGWDLQALMAHELGHEYIAAEHQRAATLGDHNRLKQLELMCDAIAIVMLHRLGLDSSRLMSSVAKITRYNQRFLGLRIDERDYPTLSERRDYARAVTRWVRRSSAGRSPR